MPMSDLRLAARKKPVEWICGSTLGGVGRRERARVRILREQRRRDHVHARVGRLRRQDRRDEQLERRCGSAARCRRPDAALERDRGSRAVSSGGIEESATRAPQCTGPGPWPTLRRTRRTRASVPAARRSGSAANWTRHDDSGAHRRAHDDARCSASRSRRSLLRRAACTSQKVSVKSNGVCAIEQKFAYVRSASSAVVGNDREVDLLQIGHAGQCRPGRVSGAIRCRQVRTVAVEASTLSTSASRRRRRPGSARGRRSTKIGCIVGLAGCRRIAPVLAVELLQRRRRGPPSSAMTISPLSAVLRSSTTTKSPSRICSSIIELPRTRST